MPDLADGQTIQVQGSARLPYILKNISGVYSCSCPAWRNQSAPIERRTCKHLRKIRGDDTEQARLGQELPNQPTAHTKDKPVAPPLLLAQVWDNHLDVKDYWMSEKLDGVRAWWDSARRCFLSRQGNVYHAPSWFTAGLPNMALDGELWIDRKAFQRTVSIVRRQDESQHWRSVLFVIFDAPTVGGPFEDRLRAVREAVREDSDSFARVLYQCPCHDMDHLRQELARINGLGGEGLMLRAPGSLYEAGRSATLLKVKTFHDAEARVVEHLPGRGRHKGRMGALAVELPDGTRFSVGTGFTDADRESPPPVGTVITFRYQELTDGGVPRFPSYVRVQRDGESCRASRQIPSA